MIRLAESKFALLPGVLQGQGHQYLRQDEGGRGETEHDEVSYQPMSDDRVLHSIAQEVG